MAISTYRVFLMHKEAEASEYSKLLDIKSFPDLGGEPEMLETTTLSDNMNTYVAGVQSLESMSFDANYSKEDFEKCKALEGEDHDYAVWFGGTGDGSSLTPTGEHGKFVFKGQMSCFPSGGGVNEVVGLRITIAPSTPIEYSET